MKDALETKTEIREYDEFSAKIEVMRDACNFLPDMENEDGYEKSKRVALDVGKVLTRLETKRKEIKEPALKRCKLIDDEAKSIKAQIEKFQLPHKDAYKAVDELNKKREAARKQELADRVTAIADLPEYMRDSPSSEVMAAMTDLQANECLDFYDMTHDALNARKRSLEKLGQMYTAKLQQEKDAEDLARLKAESEAREKKEREDAIAKKAADDARIAAERKAAEERAAIEESEQRARDAAILAERKTEEAKIREQAAIEKAAKEKIEAEAAAKKAAEDAEIAAKKAAADAVIAERKRSEEAKAAEIAEAAKREANKKHHAKINNEALAGFTAGGLSEADAKTAVELIAKGLIQNVSIRY